MVLVVDNKHTISYAGTETAGVAESLSDGEILV